MVPVDVHWWRIFSGLGPFLPVEVVWRCIYPGQDPIMPFMTAGMSSMGRSVVCVAMCWGIVVVLSIRAVSLEDYQLVYKKR